MSDLEAQLGGSTNNASFSTISTNGLPGDSKIRKQPSLTGPIEPILPPRLDEILLDTRSYPLNKAEFRKFLIKRHAVESLDCLDSISNYKQDPSVDGMMNIEEVYIERDAEKEVNISDKMREECKTIVKAAKAEGKPNIIVFDGVRREVHKLLTNDTFREFLNTRITTNLSENEADTRIREGLGFFALAIIICLVTIFVPGIVDPTMNPFFQFIRLVTFPIWFAGFAKWIQGYWRL